MIPRGYVDSRTIKHTQETARARKQRRMFHQKDLVNIRLQNGPLHSRLHGTVHDSRGSNLHGAPRSVDPFAALKNRQETAPAGGDVMAAYLPSHILLKNTPRSLLLCIRPYLKRSVHAVYQVAFCCGTVFFFHQAWTLCVSGSGRELESTYIRQTLGTATDHGFLAVSLTVQVLLRTRYRKLRKT